MDAEVPEPWQQEESMEEWLLACQPTSGLTLSWPGYPEHLFCLPELVKGLSI